MTLALVLYLKLQLMLLLGFLCWLALMGIERVTRRSISASTHLELNRALLVGVLLASVVVPLAAGLIPASFNTLQQQLLPSPQHQQEFLRPLGEMIITPLQLNAHASESATGEKMVDLLIGLLLTGMLYAVLLLGIRLRNLCRVLRSASRWRRFHSIEILFSSETRTPFSTNVLLRRQIVLPWSLLESRAQLHIALRHEIQHHRSGDLHWITMLELLKVLLFWNPVIHWWKECMENLQEYACDQALLKSGKVSAGQYRQCLVELSLQEACPVLPAVVTMLPGKQIFQVHGRQLKRRLQMLKSVQSQSRKPAYLHLLCMGCFLLFGSLLVHAQEDVAASGQDGALDQPLKQARLLLDAGDYSSAEHVLIQLEAVYAAGTMSTMDSVKYLAAKVSLYDKRQDFTNAAATANEVLALEGDLLSAEQRRVWESVRDSFAARAEKAPLTPIRVAQPEYPQFAQDQKIEGWAQVNFSVDKEGNVFNPTVVGHCAEEVCTVSASALFYSSSMDAIEKFQFNPKLENGSPVEAHDIQYIFRYNLSEQ